MARREQRYPSDTSDEHWELIEPLLPENYERHPAHSEAMIRWAAINTITRRIARGGPLARQPMRLFAPAS